MTGIRNGFPPLLPPNPAAGPAPTGAPLFRPLAVSASGLEAQRVRMEIAAENLANASVTRTAEGGPYQRRVVRLEALPMGATGTDAETSVEAPSAAAGGVRVAGIDVDTREGALVYEPGHPDADANGFVRQSNVRPTEELVGLMEARRLYEANATVFQAARAMLRRAIDI